MKAKILIAALLAASAVASNAAELTLFDQPLRTVDRATLKQAAKAAGATLVSSKSSTDTFNVSRLKLPGLTKLEVVYLKGEVVLAQYTVGDENGSADEPFRKMLVAKYGYPQEKSAWGFFDGNKFNADQIASGKYRWQFDDDMELVYEHQFIGAHHLTYVNKRAHGQMQNLLEGGAQKGAEKAAAANRSLF